MSINNHWSKAREI